MSAGWTSRREFVAMLLGAPAAAALGCSPGARAAYDGDLLDTHMAHGHAALRDRVGEVRVPDGATRRARVAIVGGGVAGLTAAWWLTRHGLDDIVLLELGDEPGGTARGGRTAVTPYPWGAHYVVAPQAHQAELVALCADLGLFDEAAPPGPDGAPTIREELRCRQPEERVFHLGRWYEGLYLHAGASAADLAQLAAFQAEVDRLVAWRGRAGRRAFTLPVSRCADDAEVAALDTQSMAAWLDARGLTSPRLRWLTDYACRDDYGLSEDRTSAWAGLLYFGARMTAPGVEAQTVVTWPEGNAALTDALAARLGPRLRRGAAVVDVAPVDGGVRVAALTADGRAEAVLADRAIVAAPHHVARRVVAPLRDGADPRPAWRPDVGAWAVANLHLRARVRERRRGAPPSWDNVLRDSPSLGYVTATHQAGRDHGPTVLTWYYPFTGDAVTARRQLAGAGHGEWAAAALADLRRAHPDLPGLVERIDVAFWGHGMPRPTPGTFTSAARRAAAAPVGPIHLAHTDLSGLALFEEALDHGVRAAREVLAALAPGARGAAP